MAKKSAVMSELVINLTARSIAYNRELQKANRQTRDWANETRQHVNTAGKYIAGMSVAAGASLAVIYKSAAEANDKLAKMSDRLGISTEALGGYRHAAELTGVSQEKFDTSIERMVKRMGEAEMGFGAAKSMLEQYGLANDDFFNKGPEQQFETLADTMQGMASASEQSAFAAAVFGREGIALVNTAKLGGEGIRELRTEAEQLGLTVSRVDAAKIEAANDAMTRAKAGFKGLANSITIELAPLVEAVANMFTDATANSNGWRDQVIDGVESVVMAVGYLGNSVRGIEIAFKGAHFVVSGFVLGVLETFRQIESGWVELYNLIAPDSAAIDPDSTIIAQLVNDANKSTFELKEELHALAMEPLPSDKIKTFFDDIRANANSAAEAVANAAQGKSSESTVTTTYDAKAADGMYQVDKWMMDSQEQQSLALTEQYAQNQELLYEAKSKENWTQIEFEERSLKLQETFHSKQKDLVAKSEKEKAKLREAAAMTALNVVTSNMSLVTDMMENSGKKQSKIYKFLLAAQKAAAIPSIMVSTQEAAMKAEAAFPPPGGTILANSVRASGYAAMGIVAGQAIAGIAHGGLEDVPEEATYLLQKGERVLSPKQNEAVKAAADKINQGGAAGVIVNLYENTEKAGSVERETGPSEEQVMNIFVANIGAAGIGAQALEQTYGLQRQGR